MTATSSSDRIEAARKALEEWDAAATPTDERGYHNGAGWARDNWRIIRESLRALIEPDAVNETTDTGLLRIYGQEPSNDPIASLRAVYDAGIQAAWESWEPENAPGTPPVVNSAEYDELCSVIDSAKNDGTPMDTKEYAAMVLDALGLQA